MAKRKNPAAVALGKLGGKAKVPKGFATMDPARRSEAARKGLANRWGKKEVKAGLAGGRGRRKR